MRLKYTRRRSGFTLVELIVAAGLTVLIMAILATGFQVGLDSLRLLKSTGDLADRLRTAETLLRYDLDAPHFDDGTTSAGAPQLDTRSNPGTLLLSELRLDRDPNVRPTGGFLQIRQAAPSTFEGSDQDQLSSTRATGHSLAMTVRRSGKTPGELFSVVENTNAAGVNSVIAANPTDVAVIANNYLSEWAEVHWFLDLSRPTVQNGVQTFPLCRRVRLLTKNSVANVAPPADPLAEVVSADPAGNSNTLAAIANPNNRLGSGGVPPAFTPASPGNRFGDDIVITNVISFEVKPTWEPAAGIPAPRPTLGAAGALPLNADFPFDDLPANQILFDTSLGGFVPAAGTPVLPARVTGVQIKIRVFDGKNNLTRQSVVTSKL